MLAREFNVHPSVRSSSLDQRFHFADGKPKPRDGNVFQSHRAKE